MTPSEMYGVVVVLALFTSARAMATRHGHHPKLSFAQPAKRAAVGEDFNFWQTEGMQSLEESIDTYSLLNTKVAKNIVLFIGDGMSIPTVTAARIYKAQKYGGDFSRPESTHLTFESFPFVGLSKPYDVDTQVGDSSATATALFSGVKTNHGTLGFDSTIDRDNVNSTLTAKKVEGVLSWAQSAGKDTGFVTTARITHATPAALYAHSHERYWEGDCPDDRPEGEIPETAHDIAWQLVNNDLAKKCKVMMGGGMPHFVGVNRSSEVADIGYAEDNDCYRDDNMDLIQQWIDNHEDMNAKFVKTAQELRDLDLSQTDYLFGLLGGSHIAFYDEITNGIDPTLPDMVEAAVQILKRNSAGFFLMVESGRIDHAHHDNTAIRALEETVQMDLAMEKLLELMEDQLDETLIIVTADHSHMMSMSGYNVRGKDILGLNDDHIDDGLPYLTLNYANGPGFASNFEVVEGNVSRVDLSTVNYKDPKWEQASWGIDNSAKHGGDEVAVYARGPMAHLFHKVHEQTHVAYVMAYSACIGPHVEGMDRCINANKNSGVAISSSGPLLYFWLLLALLRACKAL